MAHRAVSRSLLHVLRLKNASILRQLQIEEALLRADDRNWCIINDGTPDPAIVMGISGKPSQLLDVPAVLRGGIPVIKRFSGGGTVVVDHNTLFVTLICSSSALPKLQLFPQPIMLWTEGFYSSVFSSSPGFHLKEHDYVFGEKKFGGNAQSITKDRWLHHTSFLWDYDPARMAYLTIPKKAPQYRSGRTHEDFICRLKDHSESRRVFMDRIVLSCASLFDIKEASLEDAESALARKHNKSTRILGRDFLIEEEALQQQAAAMVG
eukprot:jgi/Mesen1/3084/ME000183S02139